MLLFELYLLSGERTSNTVQVPANLKEGFLRSQSGERRANEKCRAGLNAGTALVVNNGWKSVGRGPEPSTKEEYKPDDTKQVEGKERRQIRLRHTNGEKLLWPTGLLWSFWSDPIRGG